MTEYWILTLKTKFKKGTLVFIKSLITGEWYQKKFFESALSAEILKPLADEESCLHSINVIPKSVPISKYHQCLIF
jgi:hypothetical protein